MAAAIIDGSAVAARVRAEVAEAVARRVAAGLPAPGLATILVGDDPASGVYIGGKQRDCKEVGINGFDHRLGADVSQREVADLIDACNADAAVSGMILQLPVPEGLDSAALIARIDPRKDVDGLTPTSAGALAQGRPGLRPCTPVGVIELLDDAGVELRGAEAVVIGRSQLVGRPVAQLLIQRDATVTVCHSKTRDLSSVCLRADVLVAAAGVTRLVQGDWVREGAVVIDVGMHRLDEGLVGDVDFAAASERASAITPVPGGVGPMTRAMLLRNTLAAAEALDAPTGD
jgi:methylenetetrahydrofolate dehydrogenase (NADP+)/methenyltetrahydrofolate cyclohydrolase